MTITLAAAPRGNRIGFTSAGAHDFQLTIAVLPKVWRPNGDSKIVHSQGLPQGRQLNVALYETDRLHVAEAGPQVDQLLTRCLQVSSDRQGESSYEDSVLLVPAIAPRDASLREARPLAADDPVNITDLLMLFDRLGLLFPMAEQLASAPTYSPLHRPLLCRRLLDEVLALANSARRGYRTATATGGPIRGRVHPSSIARHLMIGDYRLVTSYDELTESTVLLGVVTAALELIAESAGLRSPFSGKYSTAELRQDAVALRRVLAEIPALPSTRARQEGRRLRLSRLDKPWARALQISLTLLDQIEHGAQHADSRLTDAVELSVQTDKLWERIVTEAMRHAGFTKILGPESQPQGLSVDPWVNTSGVGMGSYPDNVAFLGGRLWVVDAKYKIPTNNGWPSRDDQYQIFAYSHLVDHDGQPVKQAALVYPGRGQSRQWRRGRDSANSSCSLFAIQIPFPEPHEVRSSGHWQRYLGNVGSVLAAEIGNLATSDQDFFTESR